MQTQLTKVGGKYYRRTTREFTCTHCGRSFIARADRVGEFCSHACYSSFIKGPQNPAWNGGWTCSPSGKVREMKRRHPEKFYAREQVKKALRSGKILRQPCEICGMNKRHNEECPAMGLIATEALENKPTT